MKLRLTPSNPRILDGAMGTELIARGLDARADIAERWVMDRPDVIAEIHQAYLAAGAEAIQTCTFGALRSRLAPHKMEGRVREICSRAISLAQLGVPVVASLGPTGLCTTVERGFEPGVQREIEAQFEEAASALCATDALHLETQYHPAELVAAAEGARRGAPSTPLWISITVVVGDGGLCTPHGVPIEGMIRALRRIRPDVVGVNCSLDAERIGQAAARLVDANLGPVIVRPQARISDKCAIGRSSETPERFASRALQLVGLGVAAVGGCCGTHPDSIHALRVALRPEERTGARGAGEI
jgi:methionine synthase I (cobalamin-dependent)